MATNSELQLVISAKDEASAKLKGVSSSVSGLSKAGSALATGMKVAGAAIAAVGTAVSAMGIASVKAYGQYASIQTKMEKVFANTHNSSKEQVKVLLEQASALEKVGVVSDDVTMSFQAQMATYDFSIESIKKITPAIMDMMVAEKGVNTTTADGIMYAEGFGKAMQGQFDILRKRGFVIDKSTEKIMKNGTEAQRAAEIFKILGKTYEGVNEAMRHTPEGAIKAIGMAWDNVKKSVGQVLVEKLNLDNVLLSIADKIGVIAQTDFAGYWNRFAEGITMAKNAITEFFSGTNVIWNFLVELFGPTLISIRDTAVDAFTTMKNALEPIMPVLKVMFAFFGVLLLGALWAIGRVFAEVFKIAANIITGFVEIFSGVIQILQGIVEVFCMAAIGDWEGMKKAFIKIWEGIKTTLAGIARVIFSPFATSFEKIANAINDIWQGIVNGIKSFWNSTIGGKGFKAPDWIPKFGGKEYKIPKLALGGSVKTGQSYIVGENRPEVFVPSQSGNIKQTDQVGSREVNINFNNVSVRSDTDLDAIVKAVRNAINKEQEYYKLGAI